MKNQRIKEILELLGQGKITSLEAENEIEAALFYNTGNILYDADRLSRRGFPEAIFCSGKTYKEVYNLISLLVERDAPIIATHVDKKLYKYVYKIKGIKYNEQAQILYRPKEKGENKPSIQGKLLVISAGTSDIPVAEEAALTAELIGVNVSRLYDVGIAGIDRLFAKRDIIYQADVIITAAGMDGALPTLISGFVSVPLIALPTSIGYGANFRGVAALLTMLNSCSAGTAVVNIDNGYGAGCFATLILKSFSRIKK